MQYSRYTLLVNGQNFDCPDLSTLKIWLAEKRIEKQTQVFDHACQRWVTVDNILIQNLPSNSVPPTHQVYTANGVNGQLVLTEDKLIIKRKGFLGLLSQGLKGDKEIFVKEISSIQLKKAGMLNGYIQFGFHGGRESKKGIFDATNDENTVMFSSKQEEQFLLFKQALEEKLKIIHSPNIQMNPVTTSACDEIEKLAGLRDKGIITDEEFNAKKKQLLGI